MDYWVTHCGTDGYLYLLFQRRFLKLLMYFSVISLCVSLPINAGSSPDEGDWFERTTLNNKELSSNFKGWVHVALVLVFTLLTIRQVQKVRRDARIAYQFYQRSMSKNKDHEWLKARTIHVKGLSHEDRTGNNLKAILEKVIAPVEGQVLAVHLVPDFAKQLEYESKILDLKDLQMLVTAQNSAGGAQFNCCIPPQYKNPRNTQLKVDKLEDKLLGETMKPFKPSGHAFVCFNSIKSVNIVLNHFRVTPLHYAKLMCLQLKDKVRDCFSQQARSRGQSTFIQFNEMDAQVELRGVVGDQILLINLASDPIDILWKNIGGSNRGIFLFRRLFLHIVTIVIILFVSTPTAMLSTLKQFDTFGFLNFDWADNLPWGNFIKANLPPLVILCINQIILFLIDISALVERHETHSLYQLSVYAKSVIYLNLNMLIIPGLTLTTSTPLINILFSKQFKNLTELLGDFYISNSGIFFVSILIQQACLSSSFYLLNIQDILFSYFSPWLALEKRKIFNDSAQWRRKENFCFQYGFFYAQMMTVFGIALIFSSTIPFVTLAACLFMGLRHLVDCFQLLTYFRREVDSSGRLISTVTNTALLFVILYQMCMMAFFIIKKRPMEAMTTCLVLVFSTLFTVISYEEVYDLSKIDEVNGGIGVFNEDAFQKWKAEYEHPLVVGNVRRKANTLGIEVKTVNDWTQFIEDKEVQGILFSKDDKYRKSGFFQMSEIPENSPEVEEAPRPNRGDHDMPPVLIQME